MGIENEIGMQSQIGLTHTTSVVLAAAWKKSDTTTNATFMSESYPPPSGT